MMYIKESFVYTLPGKEMHCHSDGCGYWRSANDHGFLPNKPLRMFKVDGRYMCEGCMRDNAEEMQAWLGEEE